MKINRKYLLIFAFVSLFVFLSLIQESYAKYITKAAAITDMTVARWSILVNSQDITSNSNFSNVIEPVFPGNEHINSGIIAPTSEGYFDLVINSTNVDVSFTQTISLNIGEDNTISDLKIIGYSINDGNTIYFTDNQTTLTQNILLDHAERIQKYRIYVKWEDGSEATMDNAADTQATIDGKASVSVSVDFIQLAN